MLTILNNTTFQGKANKVEIEISFIGAASDGTKSAEILMYKNATITGGAYSAIDANNSVISVNTTNTITGGKLSFSAPLAKIDRVNLDTGAGHMHFQLNPGETYSFVGLSSATSDIIMALRWEEYFS